MKFFMSVVLAGVLAVGAFAGDQDSLKANMQKLNDTATKLENAFNIGDTVNAAALSKELDGQVKSLFSNSDKVKEMLPKGKEKFALTAMNFSRNIDKATVSMMENLDAKNFGKAQKDFMKAKQGCMNCHALVRDWGK
jgi:hypothetical protein